MFAGTAFHSKKQILISRASKNTTYFLRGFVFQKNDIFPARAENDIFFARVILEIRHNFCARLPSLACPRPWYHDNSRSSKKAKSSSCSLEEGLCRSYFSL